MAAFPLSVLALAAGVYLLIKVKREFLGKLFEVLAWLVIVLSLVSIGFGISKHFHRNHCKDDKCKAEKEVIIKEDDDERTCGMEGCTMKGDSCYLTADACEKLYGKEVCDSMHKLRGDYVFAHSECSQKCGHGGGEGKCSHGNEGNKCKGSCEGKCNGTCSGKCEHGEKNCCKGEGESKCEHGDAGREKKECCKKK